MSTTPAPRPGRPGYRARIERIKDHAADVRSLFLRCVDRPLPIFLPGMFISIAIPLIDEVRVRPYTIASLPAGSEPFEIVFNRVPGGATTGWLFARKPGDEINFTGPFGAFTLDRAPTAATVFIAEGTGIAPIRPMLHKVLESPTAQAVDLLYAADREDHLLYRKELAALATQFPLLRFEHKVSAGAIWTVIHEVVRRRWMEADADRTRQFYICGIGPGVIETRDLLRAAGYERRAVRYEKW
jgi:ferredoxin-NADP reductase